MPGWLQLNLEVTPLFQTQLVVGICVFVLGGATVLAVVFRRDLSPLLFFSVLSQSATGALGLLLAPVSAAAKLSILHIFAVAYGTATAGAFALLAALETGPRERTRGLAYKEPLLAVAMAFLLLSLAGIPPLGTFYPKYALLVRTARAGDAWVAGLVMFSSLVLLACFLPWLTRLLGAPSSKSGIERSWRDVALLCALLPSLASVVGWPEAQALMQQSG